MPATWVYTAFVIYIILGFVVAYTSRGTMTKSVTDFFLANRTIGGFVGALTYSATTYSAFMMVGLAGLVYKGGVGALGFELIYLSGLVLAAFFGPRFWLVGKKFNYVSPNEMLADRYDNKWIAILFTIASVIFLIPYSAVQLMGIGYLMEGLSKGAIPFVVGVAIATLLSIAWAWIAGMRSVAWTDSLQALIMIVAAVMILLFVVYGAMGGFGAFFGTLEAKYARDLTVPGPGFFSWGTFLGLTVPWFFFCISNPQVSQRLFISKSMSSLRGMIRGFLVFGFIYTLVSVLWGFAAKVIEPGLKNADLATPTLLASQYVPPVLALIAMIGITAAAISTLDSIMLTLSSMVARDLYRKLNQAATEESELLLGKIVIPVIAVLAFLFALQKLGLIAVLSVASSLGLMVIVPTIFGAFFWRRATAAGSIASILAGSFVALYMQFGKVTIWGHGAAIWTLLVTVVVFVAVSLATKPPAEKAEAFLGYLEKELRAKNAL
ncbi:MAG: sodium:solute symporter family protein [Bacillota bacterium]